MNEGEDPAGQCRAGVRLMRPHFFLSPGQCGTHCALPLFPVRLTWVTASLPSFISSTGETEQPFLWPFVGNILGVGGNCPIPSRFCATRSRPRLTFESQFRIHSILLSLASLCQFTSIISPQFSPFTKHFLQSVICTSRLGILFRASAHQISDFYVLPRFETDHRFTSIAAETALGARRSDTSDGRPGNGTIVLAG
jgi:hypothetical protein